MDTIVCKLSQCGSLISDTANNIWVRSRNCGCLVTWFCYQLIAKPGNKTATVSWPDPYVFDNVTLANCVEDTAVVIRWYQEKTKWQIKMLPLRCKLFHNSCMLCIYLVIATDLVPRYRVLWARIQYRTSSILVTSIVCPEYTYWLDIVYQVPYIS